MFVEQPMVIIKHIKLHQRSIHHALFIWFNVFYYQRLQHKSFLHILYTTNLQIYLYRFSGYKNYVLHEPSQFSNVHQFVCVCHRILFLLRSSSVGQSLMKRGPGTLLFSSVLHFALFFIYRIVDFFGKFIGQ